MRLPGAAEIHSFCAGSDRYLLDVNGQAVFAVDEVAFTCLSEYEQQVCQEKTGGIASLRPRLLFEHVADILRPLQDAGFFIPGHVEKYGQQESFLQALHRASPRKMWLLVSQTCNMRCEYCYAIEDRYRDEGRRMSEKVARAAIDYLVKRSGARRSLRVTFFGGEPTLNMPVVRGTVAYARTLERNTGKKIAFSMSTNATSLTDETVRFLVANGFAMQFSLDGDRAGHNLRRRSRCGEGSYDSALAGIRRFMTVAPAGLTGRIRATMTPGNHDPVRIASHFVSLGFEHFGIGSSQACMDGPRPWDLGKDELQAINCRMDELVAQLLESAESGGPLPPYNPYSDALSAMASGPRSVLPCGVGRNDAAVDVDGLLYPCHRYVGMREYVLGDVWAGIDARRSDLYYRGLLRALGESCEYCWARGLCAGQCPWTRAGRHGCHGPPLDSACWFSKRSIERLIHLFFSLRSRAPRVFESVVMRGEAWR